MWRARWPILNKREIVGFALAPLPVLGPLTLLFAMIVMSGDTASAAAMIELPLMGYGATLLIGLPVHLYLRSRGRHELAAYVLLTAAGCVLIGATLAGYDALCPPSLQEDPFGMRMSGPFGAKVTIAFTGLACLGAWIFWRTAVRERSASVR